MGTNYTRRLRESGRYEEFQREWKKTLGHMRHEELTRLLRAWSAARNDVRAEFMVAVGIWDGSLPASPDPERTVAPLLSDSTPL